MATTNEILYDATVHHAVDLQGYSNAQVSPMIALLNKADPELFAKLQSALERLPADSYTVQRLDALLRSVRDVNAQAYAELDKQLTTELREYTGYELDYQKTLFETTLPVTLSVASVSAEQVYAAAMAQPFQGKLLSEWGAELSEARMTRIRDAIRMGYVQNETVPQIVQRIKGTRALKYADGLLDIDRRHVQAVVRTAIKHTANFANDRFYQTNDSLIKGLRWTSTLDSRTSSICQSLDGKIYPVDSGKRPPAHWNCRSVMTPVIKSWKELGIDAEEFPAGTRSSLDGQVPASLNYSQWLKKQSQSRQNEILGSTKAKLFRDGGLEVSNFVSRAGHTYTLAELRLRDAAAFDKAGI